MKKKRAPDWMRPAKSAAQPMEPAAAPYAGGITYNPDLEFETIGHTAVKNPVIAFNEAVKEGRAKVSEAWLFEGRFDRRGRLMESQTALRAGMSPYRITHVTGHGAFEERAAAAREAFRQLPGRIKRLEEKRKRFLEGVQRLKDAKLLEDSFDTDDALSGFDSGQYTEYAPTYAGPFNKQLYQHDYLTMHARAFEAKNHNPLAKRIIDILAQYAFGRRFKVSFKDDKKKAAWEAFDEENKIITRCCKFWAREYPLYGELMVDKATWQSIDPSTVLDIITDPDDITKVYYYHQSYSTAYQQYTGADVRGARGGKNVAPVEFIIRQLPFDQVLHMKGNVVSQEKRGRSILFPVLGWLKRIRDLYNAEILRAQVQACFIYDDKITGSEADVNEHAARYASIPRPMSVFVHNEGVERKPLSPDAGSARGSLGVGDEILGLIATAVGIPKQFFNVMDKGSGSRVGGLVGAEPFEKVIEDMQSEFETLLLEIAKHAIEDAGLTYEKGDIEFIFPSVTKDTTSETITNIQKAESGQFIDHETAANMISGELNITGFDYEESQKKIKERVAEMPIVPPLSPSSRFDPAAGDEPAPSQVHGDGKRQLKKDMNNL